MSIDMAAQPGGKRQVRPLRLLILVRTPSVILENVLLGVHGLCSIAAHGASSAFVRRNFSRVASDTYVTALPGVLMM